MAHSGGRPRGPELSDLEVRHLKLLYFVRDRARSYASAYDEQLEDYVLELRDAGYSARAIAETLDVGTSTVQGWTANARRRRDEKS